MRAAGPDGDLVLPEECTDERVCFEAMVRKGGTVAPPPALRDVGAGLAPAPSRRNIGRVSSR
jgi:hypothetical protein